MHFGIAALFLMIVTSLPCPAQNPDESDDPFDTEAFDATIAQGRATDDTNRVRFLPGLLFVSQSTATRLTRETSYGADSRFDGKAFAKITKPDLGSLYAGINYRYYLFAAANSPAFRTHYQRMSADFREISLSLSELHFSFDINKKVFIRIGSQLLSWGTSYFWSPVDFINRQKATAPVLGITDARTGKPGVRIHIPLKTANIFLFTDFSAITDNGSVSNPAKTIAQAWRIDAVLGGVRIGTVGYVSKNAPLNIGFDATGNVLSADVYGECALSIDKNNDYMASVAASAGGSKTFGTDKNFTGRAEVYYNDTGYTDTDISSLPYGSFTPFYSGKWYAFAEISAVRLAGERLALSLFGFVNMSDGSYAPSVSATVTLPRLVPLNVFVRYYGGKSGREFSSLYGGAAWQAGLRITIDL